jgi:hypothetical protein
MTAPQGMAGRPQPAEEGPPAPGAPPRPSLPCLLAQLDTPPEVAAAVDRHCRRYGFFGRRRAFIEESVKLDYYFGGLIVLAVATPNGLEVLAAGPPGSEEFGAQFATLRRQRTDLIVLNPYPWDDTRTLVLASRAT